jgi:N utilization substance protein A
VRYVVAALAPAQVVRIMVDDEKRSMDVIVPDDQLSLAIGKKGQNVRLAVQLTRWKIDIKSETYMRAVQEELASALSVVPEAGEYEAKLLMDNGVASLEELAEAETELLLSIPGILEEGAAAVKARARELAIEKQKKAREAAAAAAAGDGGASGATGA